jgi:hypothetical protein
MSSFANCDEITFWRKVYKYLNFPQKIAQLSPTPHTPRIFCCYTHIFENTKIRSQNDSFISKFCLFCNDLCENSLSFRTDIFSQTIFLIFRYCTSRMAILLDFLSRAHKLTEEANKKRKKHTNFTVQLVFILVMTLKIKWC